jgi:hypothetical protein
MLVKTFGAAVQGINATIITNAQTPLCIFFIPLCS